MWRALACGLFSGSMHPFAHSQHSLKQWKVRLCCAVRDPPGPPARSGMEWNGNLEGERQEGQEGQGGMPRSGNTASLLSRLGQCNRRYRPF